MVLIYGMAANTMVKSLGGNTETIEAYRTSRVYIRHSASPSDFNHLAALYDVE